MKQLLRHNRQGNKRVRVVTLLLLSSLIVGVLYPDPTSAYSYAERKWISSSAEYWLDIADWDPTLIIYSDRTWDDAGSPFRFNYKGQNVYQQRDGYNTVARYVLYGADAEALAVTYTLSVNNSIVEVDTVFNMRFGWGCCGEPKLYDVRNVMTHEFGHWLALNDLYNWLTDRNKTMYYKASPGETKKRTLHQDDLNGINFIY